jgi:hypothetical protein
MVEHLGATDGRRTLIIVRERVADRPVCAHEVRTLTPAEYDQAREAADRWPTDYVLVETEPTTDEVLLRVTCEVPGCGFEAVHVVKAGAEEEARWHRQHHKGAVPKVDGHTCACGWEPSEGTVTKADRDASLACHLGTVHGLVS